MKKKYMVVVNLSGVSGPIVLRPSKDLSGRGQEWWDSTGDFGWREHRKPRKDNQCYQFVTDSERDAKMFKLGATILAKRLKDYLS